MIYPNMESEFTHSYLERLMGHLDVCKDVCDDFGVNTVLTPFTEKKIGRDVVVGFTVKSFRNPNKVGTLASDGNFEFAPDPMWDNDDDWDLVEQQIAADCAEYTDEDEIDNSNLPDIEELIPDNDGKIVDVTKAWVSLINILKLRGTW